MLGTKLVDKIRKYFNRNCLFSNLILRKMDTLRKFGSSYGVYDTKKSELVEEIIEKAPYKDIIKFIER